PQVLDIPAELRPWEPAYPVSSYSDTGAEHPEPPASGQGLAPVTVPGPDQYEVVDDPDTELAVRQLLEAWTAQSTGRVEVVCVEGTAAGAIGALGVGSARIAEITAAEAI